MNIPTKTIIEDVLSFMDKHSITKYTDIAHLINMKVYSNTNHGLIDLSTRAGFSGKVGAYILSYKVVGINPPLELDMQTLYPATRLTLICKNKIDDYETFCSNYEGNVIQMKNIESVDMLVIRLELNRIKTLSQTWN